MNKEVQFTSYRSLPVHRWCSRTTWLPAMILFNNERPGSSKFSIIILLLLLCESATISPLNFVKSCPSLLVIYVHLEIQLLAAEFNSRSDSQAQSIEGNRLRPVESIASRLSRHHLAGDASGLIVVRQQLSLGRADVAHNSKVM